MAIPKEDAGQKLQTIGEETKKVAETSPAVQQSDNVAHALAGAGGGLLSMALTYVSVVLVEAIVVRMY